MALRFPVLFVGFVSFSSLRPSVVIIVTHYATPCVVVLLIGVPFLRGLSFSGHCFLFRPVILCFMFYVLCFMFYVLCFMFYVLFWIGFLVCLYVLDYGFGMFVFGIAFMAAVYRHSSRPASILTALLLPHASSPSSSPPISLLYRFSFVFSRRRLLRRSSPSPLSRGLHLSLGLRPSTFGSSSVVLVVCWALAWTLDHRRAVLSQMQGFALRGVF